MPRKNRRERFEPVDLTPPPPPPPRPSEPPSSYPMPFKFNSGGRTFEQRLDAERNRQRSNWERQRNAEINGGIDWSVCLVPGCGEDLSVYATQIHRFKEWRDHSVALPLCFKHLSVAYTQANLKADEPLMVEAVSSVLESRQAKDAEVVDSEKRAHLARTDGHIYYIRLNGLIKVGWSRTLTQRLRDYGPDVEVLCHYPARRQDETTLHRQLRPYLAKGREWYQDSDLLRDMVAQAVDKYGPPSVTAWWSQPKKVVAGKRHH